MAGKLPIFQSQDKNFQLMQTSWASQLNPVLLTEIVNSQVLQQVALISGNNTVNHKLGRNLVGWVIVRQRGAASFYDLQDTNGMPNLTLLIHASANVSVDILVF